MNTLPKLCFLSLLILVFFSCQTGGESIKATTESSDTVQLSSESKQTDSINTIAIAQKDTLISSDTLLQQTEQALKKKSIKYERNFVVSFFSRGSGIDSKIFNNFKVFVETFNQKNNTTIKYKLQPWGKEGEKDFCFEPDSNPNFDLFITEAKEFLSESKLVRVKEHSECRI